MRCVTIFGMNVKSKDLWNISLPLLILFLIVGNKLSSKIQQNKISKWSFEGIVQKVDYDIKGIPTITVNDREYNLYHTIWNRNFKIIKGDTIIKMPGDLRIKLLRHNLKDTVYFNDNG